ncbi:GTP cyclohydrolase II [Roseivivax halotolerans]|uniref:GTP cyclohydrolase-2 n=1 Tax=Roseivivax halotolerans TaxID=93684 RepID=A0A1I6AMT0_9RHOB|nr:GTP cyclohydrolase II [Roseivivax halotolerans]SFQ69962.1 GTP cyclohydrolase II [Roseivivax halotolerans]
MNIFRPSPDDLYSNTAALGPRIGEQVARLRGDLRLGLSAVLFDEASASLVAWVENLTEERLAAMLRLGQAEMVVTGRRAAALGLYSGAAPTGAVRLSLQGATSLADLHALAGRSDIAPTEAVVTPGGPAREAHEAAILLAKSEQVLPAVLVVDLSAQEPQIAQLGLVSMQARDVIATLAAEPAQARVSLAKLPMAVSDSGRVHVFQTGNSSEEHYAIEIGNPDLSKPVTVRLHSACFTGDVLGSKKCDCGPQLRGAMQAMSDDAGGVILYLNQEGRGIGLANKMRAYGLQEAGLDTVEANHWLGFEDDERDFRAGATILHRMGIRQIRLMTNNPAKIAILSAHGIEVVERVPLHVGHTDCNERYLATKAAKSGHLLP